MLKNVGYARVIEKLCIFAVRILFINLNKKTFMKKMIATMAACAFMLSTTAFGQSNGPLTKEADGTFVVNTTTLGKGVKGYKSATPLKIYIKKDKIQKIEALPNKETPNFFKKVDNAILPKWNGKSVKAALKMKVDAVTGATLSSNAVKENVKLGLEYYQKNKK